MSPKNHLNYFIILLMTFSYSGISQTDANVPLNGITIYIDYPDVPAAVTANQLDSLINGVYYQEPGVERTFRNYWHEQTRRNIVMQHDVFFYTAPMPATYYETLTWQDGILLWQDALEYVITNNPGYDWSALNLRPDGALKSVMIISSEWGPTGVGAAFGPDWTLSNGVKIKRIYGSVLKAPWDTTNNMFMTLHESAHSIFALPDTYDTEYNSGGTSFFTLMSGGATDVEPIGGPFRAQYNWGTVLEVTPGTHTFTLRADSDSVLVLRNIHDSLEFFTVEARKQSTMGNSLFPAPLGLLIWHSDTKVNTSNTLEDMLPTSHYAHSIEQADGLFELEASVSNSGDMGDLYLPGNSFSDVTVPNTKWWDGTSSGIVLTNIQLIGSDKISFTITVPNPHSDHYDDIPQSGWTLVSAPPSQMGYEPEKAFDGDVSTYYHVPWGSTAARPHDFIVDLGQTYMMNEFYYEANKNDFAPWEGRIKNYEIYISEDGVNWGSPVASGVFYETGIRQYVLFPLTTGRYLKFSAPDAYGVLNDVRTSIAEINLRGFDADELSLLENNSEFTIRLYPNPTAGQFTVELPTAENATIIVTDILGNQILELQTSETMTTLELDHTGVYIVYVQTKEGTATQQIVVTR
jgi:M6 family metalloprotease-like protein